MDNNIKEKLAHCFSLAFPEMKPSQYATATTENTKAWDSVLQVTLLTLIGEEFGIEIDFAEFEGATSFESLASRISEITASA